MTDLMDELEDLGKALATNLTNKGVNASYTDGLTTLANKILNISQSGGHCYGVVFDSTSSIGVQGTATIGVTIYDNYSPLSNVNLTLNGSDSSTTTATTNSSGYATFTVTGTSGNTITYSLTYQGVTKTCSVNYISKLYNPLLDGTEPTTTIATGYDFTTGNSYAGNYHQCGYISDGFDNSGDWELTMTLQTSSWDGGFCLFLYPYPLQTCSQYNNKWDCIFKNTEKDILEWIDGYIKINNNGVQSIGISYTRNTTMNVKITKTNGTTFSYYENDTLKGTYTWTKLGTAPRVYLGTLTWGGSGSVNRFSNVEVNPLGSGGSSN